MDFTAADQSALRSLLNCLVDGQLDEGARTQLNAMLRVYPEAREMYCENVQLHAMLASEAIEGPHFLGQALASTPETVGSISLVRSWSQRLQDGLVPLRRRLFGSSHRPVFWSVAVAGVLFAGYFTLLAWNLRHHRMPNGTDGNRSVVATVEQSRGATWTRALARQSSDVHAGQDVSLGEPLRIESGMVELRLKQGATLVVAGPAEWSIDGENAATLRQGRLVAKVPRQAVGFVVNTPTARIVDLGTEFGVAVEKDNETQLHVFTGVVTTQAVEPSNDEAERKPAERISAGESRRFRREGSGEVSASSIQDIAEKFEREVAAPKLATRKNAEAAPVDNNAYPNAIMADRPIAYWRLSDGEDSTVRDDSGRGTHGAYQGQVKQKEPGIDVRDANRSVRFLGEAQRGWVSVKELVLGPSFTMELWAKSVTPTWNSHGWFGSARVTNGMIFHPYADVRRWTFSVYSGQQKYRKKYLVGEHFPDRIDDRFHHYAVSYDASTDTGRMYFDGELVVKQSPVLGADKRLPKANVPLLMGYDPGANGPQYGNGWIDEVAIYDRALSAESLQTHFKLGSAQQGAVAEVQGARP